MLMFEHCFVLPQANLQAKSDAHKQRLWERSSPLHMLSFGFKSLGNLKSQPATT